MVLRTAISIFTRFNLSCSGGGVTKEVSEVVDEAYKPMALFSMRNEYR